MEENIETVTPEPVVLQEPTKGVDNPVDNPPKEEVVLTPEERISRLRDEISLMSQQFNFEVGKRQGAIEELEKIANPPTV